MSSEDYKVRVDTKAGQRKTYVFDNEDEANAFVIGCEDTVVSGPTRTISYSEDESD